MSRKRLLYLCADRGIPIGGTKGASIHVREFVETLPQIGYEAIVAASRFAPGGEDQSKYPVHQLPTTSEPEFLNGANDLDPDKQMLREAKDYYRKEEVERTLATIYEAEPFDLVYERYSLFSTAGCVFARSNNLPFVLEVNAPLVLESGEYRQLSQLALARSVEKFLFTEANHIVSVSERLKEYILGVAPKAQVTVVPNGVTLDRYEASDGKFWRAKLQPTIEAGLMIGFVGSVKPWHGVDLLIEALAQVNSKTNDAQLCIIGNGDEKYEMELRDRCRQHNLSDRVTFVGAVPHDEVPSVLKSMDVLVAPYPDLENFYFSPLKVFEYMAAGRPIIASAIGQITDILTHEQTTLLVPPGDCAALAAAINRLQHQPELGKNLAAAALEEVRQHHTWRQRLLTIGDIVQSCLPGAASGVE